MNSFLKAEWKTMVSVVVFCGAIFSWFYVKELKLEKEKNAEYVYECIVAGTSILDYKLGAKLSDLNDRITDFKMTKDDGLNISRYESPDGGVVLNFRKDVLSAIEYYPEKMPFNSKCVTDAATWKQKKAPVRQSIVSDKTVYVVYAGLTLVQENQSISSDIDKAPDYKDVGWIVTSK